MILLHPPYATQQRNIISISPPHTHQPTMFFATSCKLALLALAVLSASLAEAQDCQAIGSLTGEITIKRNGAKVGYTKRDPCTGDKNFGITSECMERQLLQIDVRF